MQQGLVDHDFVDGTEIEGAGTANGDILVGPAREGEEGVVTAGGCRSRGRQPFGGEKRTESALEVLAVEIAEDVLGVDQLPAGKVPEGSGVAETGGVVGELAHRAGEVHQAGEIERLEGEHEVPASAPKVGPGQRAERFGGVLADAGCGGTLRADVGDVPEPGVGEAGQPIGIDRATTLGTRLGDGTHRGTGPREQAAGIAGRGVVGHGHLSVEATDAVAQGDDPGRQQGVHRQDGELAPLGEGAGVQVVDVTEHTGGVDDGVADGDRVDVGDRGGVDVLDAGPTPDGALEVRLRIDLQLAPVFGRLGVEDAEGTAVADFDLPGQGKVLARFGEDDLDLAGIFGEYPASALADPVIPVAAADVAEGVEGHLLVVAEHSEHPGFEDQGETVEAAATAVDQVTDTEESIGSTVEADAVELFHEQIVLPVDVADDEVGALAIGVVSGDMQRGVRCHRSSPRAVSGRRR